MPHRIEVASKPGFTDALGKSTRRRILEDLEIDVESIKTVNVYTLKDDISKKDLRFLGEELFSDPVAESLKIDRPILNRKDSDWIVQVGFKPGVKDAVGEASSGAISRLTGKEHPVYTSKIYAIKGDIRKEQAERIAKDLLANEAVENFSITEGVSFEKESYLEIPEVRISHTPEIKYIDLNVPDEDLLRISEERHLALNLKEMEKVRGYSSNEHVLNSRLAKGLEKLTDAELEVLGQSWSEHCKHKIFNAEVDYRNSFGFKRKINSLFDTYIKKQAYDLKKKLPWVVSVLWDNSGVVRFNDDWLLCVKCETHNSPSNKEPYGGAITGIVGVYRDPMGTGKGARIICGTYGFCTGDPDYDGDLMPELHPRRLLEGVRKGVEHGGNKSGVPTLWGITFFDDGYKGKPAIYVKANGLIPSEVDGEPGHKKHVNPGDLIVMCGGRVGIDGIHGATESSLEAGEHITMGHVQMGDPYTQKKMHDFLLEAREKGLYNFIQDNGAGGLSSSVGETGTFSNGFRMDLKKVPLKYQGLDPWQILVSESQERMTLAVPPGKIEEFRKLAELHEVESSLLGEFNGSGKFEVSYGDKPVAYLDMDFVHGGVPQMKLKARWKGPRQRGLKEPEIEPVTDHGKLLKEMLSRPNIASKEYITRQYDHEVQGTSAVKPLVGKDSDVNSDAAVLKPLLDSWEGLAMSDGINPDYNHIDTYWGTLMAMDEAIRRVVAVGADPERICLNDNFCWPSPLPSENNPDAEYKMAQLVRANRALYKGTTKLRTPCVSGKDSMSMDGTIPDKEGKMHRVSAPPTIKFAADGKVDDVRKCVTMDFKRPGELIYVIGKTRDELGGSELYKMLGETGRKVPKVRLRKLKKTCRAVHDAIEKDLLSSCHGVYKGGLEVALSQSAFAGGLGADVYLGNVPTGWFGKRLNETKKLCSESPGRFVVTVPYEKHERFERLMNGGFKHSIPGIRKANYGFLGYVKNDNLFKVYGNGDKELMNEDIGGLKGAWKAPYSGR